MHSDSLGAAHHWLLNICIALFSTVMSLGLIEVAFRIVAYYDDMRTHHAFLNLGKADNVISENMFTTFRQLIRLSESQYIIYELIPNTSLSVRNKLYTMNAHGFRGPDYSSPKSKRVFRIVGLGDSLMWGWGVSDDEYYLSLLSQHLNRSSPDGYSWEIINTAVPGYNTVMEVETFKEKGLLYQPDLVIIDYVSNDLSLPNFIRKEENYFSLQRSLAVEFFLSRLNQRHRNFNDGLVDAPLDAFGQSFESDPSRVPAQYKDMIGPHAYRVAMAELRALGVNHSFPVIVFTHWYMQDFLKDMLRDLDLPILEAGDVLKEYMSKHGIKEYVGSPLTVSNEDPHPSALGHTILAGILYDYLKDSGILSQIYTRRGVGNASE